MANTITPEELYKLSEKGDFVLVDIRQPDVFRRGHVEGKGPFSIKNLPYDDIIEKEESLTSLPKDKQIVVVCYKGITSARVVEMLQGLGYQSISLEGGMAGWGKFYTIKTVVESTDLSIYQVIRPAKGCLSYIITSQGKGAIIDPSRHYRNYIDFFKERNIKPEIVLDTHAHADHISGGKKLSEELKVPYYLHPYDGIHPMDMLPAAFKYSPAWSEESFKVGNVEIKTLHVPGHTLGNLAFLLNGKYLFAGDTIFIAAISRPDLGGHARAWTTLHYHSLRELLKLPDDTIVLPGHYHSLHELDKIATLGELKKKNEGLIMAQKSLQEFTDYIMGNIPEFPEEYIEIKRVNIGLKEVEEEQASELESGKNICSIKKI